MSRKEGIAKLFSNHMTWALWARLSQFPGSWDKKFMQKPESTGQLSGRPNLFNVVQTAWKPKEEDAQYKIIWVFEIENRVMFNYLGVQ